LPEDSRHLVRSAKVWSRKRSKDCLTLVAVSTVELPDDVIAALAAAAAERGMTVDELAAKTLAATFGPRRRVLSFAAIGSAEVDRGGAHSEELLEEGGFGIDSADL